VLNRGSPNRSDSNYRSRSFVIRQLFWWSAVNPNLSHYCGTSSYRLSVTACWINSCVTAARPGIIRFSFKLFFFYVLMMIRHKLSFIHEHGNVENTVTLKASFTQYSQNRKWSLRYVRSKTTAKESILQAWTALSWDYGVL